MGYISFQSNRDFSSALSPLCLFLSPSLCLCVSLLPRPPSCLFVSLTLSFSLMHPYLKFEEKNNNKQTNKQTKSPTILIHPHLLHTVALFFSPAASKSPGDKSCGIYEELSGWSLDCSTATQTFKSFGPRVEINGTFMETAFCDSDGNCQSNDPSRYLEKKSNTLSPQTEQMKSLLS